MMNRTHLNQTAKSSSMPLFLVCLSAICCIINLFGGMIAVFMKLPVYLDSIGTIFAGLFAGPAAGILTGIGTSLINGLSFDPISLYLMPSQIIVGYLTAKLFYRRKENSLGLLILKIATISFAGTVSTSIIVAYLFGGVSSAGSSLIVAYLHQKGLNMVLAVFVVQVFTDLLDRSISFLFAFWLEKMLPKNLKAKFTR